ncbi:MAG: M12 family metallopeptidase [Pseudomonadota bacterium]
MRGVIMSITLVSRGTALLTLTIIALILAIPTRSASQDIVGEATTDSPGRTIFTEQGRTFETIDDMIIELAGPGLLSVELKDVRKWPNGRLPIAFSENYSEAEKTIFFEACQWWSDVSKVECVPRSNETNYIFVNAHASVNNSYLGMIGGKQTLNLVSRGNRAVIAHELAHALGFSHQHNAPNRNSFVAILWNNIKTGRKHNFRMIPPAKAIVFVKHRLL